MGVDDDIPVEHDGDGDDTACGYGVAPVVDDDIAGGDFEGHHGGLENEEVPSGGEPEGFVDVAAGEANEGGRDGEVGHHLCHAQRYGEDEGAPSDGKGGQISSSDGNRLG